MSDWVGKGMAVAELVSSWSKDPSSKVGCYISDSMHRPISFGFNGFPRGIADDDRLDDRELKYDMILHAEVNAILNAQRSVEGGIMYVSWRPCPRCAAIIIQAGITDVYSPYPVPERWVDSMNLAVRMLEEAGVTYHATG